METSGAGPNEAEGQMSFFEVPGPEEEAEMAVEYGAPPTEAVPAEDALPADINVEPDDSRDYLLPIEAARFLGMSPKTLSTWARQGKVNVVKTLGGHHRFLKQDILQLRDKMHHPDQP